MSKEIMSECMAEAATLMRGHEWDDGPWWFPCLATLAVALYQERCRVKDETRPPCSVTGCVNKAELSSGHCVIHRYAYQRQGRPHSTQGTWS